MRRIGIDVGGTNTDAVLLEDGRVVHAVKTPTTEDVTGSGTSVLETGKWVATSADGKHLDHGQYATFYKKEGGSWKIYRDIWNSSMAHK